MILSLFKVFRIFRAFYDKYDKYFDTNFYFKIIAVKYSLSGLQRFLAHL